ncbi:hypothetical protein [Burkholderia glumae]|uniref:hypothetical protein n=1 Tax=Burkholderia glumae TaxID=337 RepID=UPI002150CF22|nr:hypothetical protein [Burkholderia glumae]
MILLVGGERPAGAAGRPASRTARDAVDDDIAATGRQCRPAPPAARPMSYRSGLSAAARSASMRKNKTGARAKANPAAGDAPAPRRADAGAIALVIGLYIGGAFDWNRLRVGFEWI